MKCCVSFRVGFIYINIPHQKHLYDIHISNLHKKGRSAECLWRYSCIPKKNLSLWCIARLRLNSINLICEKSTVFHESQFRSQNKHIEYISQVKVIVTESSFTIHALNMNTRVTYEYILVLIWCYEKESNINKSLAFSMSRFFL